MLNFLYIPLKKKIIFTKTRPLVDIQTNGHTDMNCYRHFRNFYQMLIKHELYRQIFEKFPNVPGQYAHRRGRYQDQDRERETYNKCLISFSLFKCIAHLQEPCEFSALLLDSGAKFTLNSVRWTQLHTWPLADTDGLISERTNIK